MKHSGHHRWPLGNVPASQVDGHFRSVQLRHERAERQWKDMLKKIGGVGSSRSKDKMKGRTKEFERLLSFVEDARKCRGLIDCLTHELSSKSSRY